MTAGRLARRVRHAIAPTVHTGPAPARGEPTWYVYTDDLLGNRGAWALNASRAVVVVFVLGSPWVRRATGWAVQPNLDWLPRRDPPVDTCRVPGNGRLR